MRSLQRQHRDLPWSEAWEGHRWVWHDRRLAQPRAVCPGVERDGTAMGKATPPRRSQQHYHRPVPSCPGLGQSPAMLGATGGPGALACHSSAQPEGSREEEAPFSTLV